MVSLRWHTGPFANPQDGSSIPDESRHQTHPTGRGTDTCYANHQTSSCRRYGHRDISPDCSRIFREQSGRAVESLDAAAVRLYRRGRWTPWVSKA